MRLGLVLAAAVAAALGWNGAIRAAEGWQGETLNDGEPAILLLGWNQPLVPPPPPPPVSSVLEEAPLVAPAADDKIQYQHAAPASPGYANPSGSDCCNGDGSCNSGCGNQSCCNDGWLSSCCDCGGGILDNTVGWVGWDAYKGVADAVAFPPGAAAGFMNSSGAVSGFNTGIGLTDSGIHAQVGASYGLYDWLGRDSINPSASEHQVFITAGVFKRSNVCCDDRIAWGLVYDQFFASNYGVFADEIALSQARGLVGYALNDCNEVGVWGSLQLQTDRVSQSGGRNIHTANQFNAYWRHNWCFGGETMAYTGWFDQAGTNALSFGMMGLAPLNDCVSLYGNFAYVVPVRGAGFVGSNDLIWNVSVGVQFSFGSKSRSCNVSGRQGLPLLPVANNGTFLITR